LSGLGYTDEHNLSKLVSGAENAKAEVVPSVNQETINAIAVETVEPTSTIVSDGLNVYDSLKNEGFKHVAISASDMDIDDLLEWIHTFVSNLKAFLNGTYHGVGRHLQAYLDEFCYRFNRCWHKHQLFTRLLTKCVNATPVRCTELMR